MRRGWKAKPQRWRRGSRCGARAHWRKRFRWRRWKSWMRLCRNASRRCMCRPQHWSRRSRKRGKAWRALSRPCPNTAMRRRAPRSRRRSAISPEMSGYAIRTCCPDAAGLRPTGSMRSRKRDWCVSRSRRKSGRRRGRTGRACILRWLPPIRAADCSRAACRTGRCGRWSICPGRSPRAPSWSRRRWTRPPI